MGISFKLSLSSRSNSGILMQDFPMTTLRRSPETIYAVSGGALRYPVKIMMRSKRTANTPIITPTGMTSKMENIKKTPFRRCPGYGRLIDSCTKKTTAFAAAISFFILPQRASLGKGSAKNPGKQIFPRRKKGCSNAFAHVQTSFFAVCLRLISSYRQLHRRNCPLSFPDPRPFQSGQRKPP